MNVAPKLSEKEYKKNFTEHVTPFNRDAAVAEANRCLYCYDSPCMDACPTHIDISEFIRKIATGNMKGSAKTILSANWVPLTCAKACPVEVLCEGACVFNDKQEKPIEIGRLQRHTMDWFYQEKPSLFTPASPNGKSIGVIGSGPAGLACAAEGVMLGFDVTIYESNDTPGGLDTWGIAPYKMSQADSLTEVEYIKSLGVKIQTGVTIGKDKTIAQLEEAHDTIFIGVGLPQGKNISLPGSDLKGVENAVDYIAKVKAEKYSQVDVGRKVAIIGCGNTAIDAATESVRLGAEEVYIIYRRGKEEMTAYWFEYELAQKDNVRFFWLTNPVRIEGEGHVQALVCEKMELVAGSAGERKKPQAVSGSEFSLPVDMVIKSVGQDLGDHFLSGVEKLEIANSRIKVNPETFQTDNPKYFAGGDCINGGKEVVNAAYDGKKAAQGIHAFLFPTTAE